jgi:hypothetical protein
VRQIAELVVDDIAGQGIGAVAAGLGDENLFARRPGDGLALTQQDLAGGGFGRQLLRARLTRRGRTQAVLRGHGQRGGRHGQEGVGRDLAQADALADAAAGAQREQGNAEGQDGGGAKAHVYIRARRRSGARVNPRGSG